MTPNCKTALESVAGRTLTGAEVTQINGYLPSRFDSDIATTLSVGRGKKLKPLRADISIILSALWPDGGSFLDNLVTTGTVDRNIFWLLEQLRYTGWDLSCAALQEELTRLATNKPLIASQVAILKDMPLAPDPIDPGKVSATLNQVGGALV